MKNALNNELVGMLGGMFLWLVANLKQGGFHFIKQALPPNISAGSVWIWKKNSGEKLKKKYGVIELKFFYGLKQTLIFQDLHFQK